MMGWQTLEEGKDRVQTLLERGRKMTLAECLRDKQQEGVYRAAGARSQPLPSHRFRD